MQTDWFEGEAQSAVVGSGLEFDRVADYVVDFDVFCCVGLVHGFFLSVCKSPSLDGYGYLRNGSIWLPGSCGNAGPLATKMARMSGCSWS